MYRLGNYYQENSYYDKALNLYGLINNDNPHFKEAAIKMDEIAMYILSNNDYTDELDKNHKRYLIAQRLRYNLNSGNNRLAGKLYKES